MRLTQAQKTLLDSIRQLGKASRQDLFKTVKGLSVPCIDANLKVLKDGGLLTVKKEKQERRQHDEKHSATVNVYSLTAEKVTF